MEKKSPGLHTCSPSFHKRVTVRDITASSVVGRWLIVHRIGPCHFLLLHTGQEQAFPQPEKVRLPDPV